jgi:zinc protease
MAKFSSLKALRLSTMLIASVASSALLLPEALLAREAAASAQAAPKNPADWLYAGSDIPRDTAWQFGVLPNGLRYAVRPNGVPPGQVAIRVRMDVGSLHEREEERGYAHLLEHLSFRGSTHIPDGDAKRIWQRFGVTFGSDSNAQTTPTQTVYKLDLPSFTAATLDESVKLLSGMVRAPGISAQAVQAERGVVMAELRENDGPQKRISDQLTGHLFAGQLLADRSPIGTLASLTKAEAGAVAAFHQRWYRPERAVIVVSGDGDPAVFEQMIKKHFSDWQGVGAAPADPFFGNLDAKAPEVKNIVEAGQPLGITVAMVRPWVKRVDTLENTHRLYLEYLAQALVNRRLENLARGGGSFLVASVSQENLSRSADATVVQAVPLGDWKSAFNDVQSALEDARTHAPSAADIEREANEIAAYLRKEADNAQNEPGARLADDIVRAVDINEVVTTPASQVAIFDQVRKLATPEKMLEVSRTIFNGTVQRLSVTSPTPVEGGEAALLAALKAPIAERSDRLAEASVDYADLPSLGTAGTIVSEMPLNGIRAKRVQLSNGVTAIVSDNMIEPGKVRVRVRFGNGQRSLSPMSPNLLWSGDYALMASGVGPWGQNELDQAMNGRQIQMNFSIEDDAFEIAAESSPADLPDQLKLLVAKLAHPRWDAAPVARMRVGMLTGFDLQSATPNAVLDTNLSGWLSDNDRRFAAPTREEIDALTPEAFRKFWEPLLASGPIEVQLFGDLSAVDEQALLASTFGALPRREAVLPFDGSRVAFPKARAVPKLATHKGDKSQAAAMTAWKTSGGQAQPKDARALEVLAAIFSDRLFDRLRAEQGASYGPIVESYWPNGFEGSGGYLLAGSLLAPKDVKAFYGMASSIAADLVAKPVSEDELARNVGPIREQVMRASTGNVYWMHLLRGASRDERVVRNAVMLEQDVNGVTAAEIQRVAKQYLGGKSPWTLAILPEGMTLDQSAAQ